MADRRLKQKKFEESHKKPLDKVLKIERPIHIITWGKSLHARPPSQSERNFDVRGVSYRNVSKDLDLKRVRGDDDVLYERIKKTERFNTFVQTIVRIVNENNFECISINCAKERHRSRAVARAVQEIFERSTVQHLDS